MEVSGSVSSFKMAPKEEFIVVDLKIYSEERLCSPRKDFLKHLSIPLSKKGNQVNIQSNATESCFRLMIL